MALSRRAAGMDWDQRLLQIETGDNRGTTVLFRHEGWATTEELFPFIAYSWAQILPRLKALAEPGTREPFFKF